MGGWKGGRRRAREAGMNVWVKEGRMRRRETAAVRDGQEREKGDAGVLVVYIRW
jgi:hypothetical protein